MVKRLTKSFAEEEFECPCCGKVKIAMELVELLQQLRDVIKEPIIVTSGYRCQQYNESVNGFVRSKHMEGKAADIKVSDMTPKWLAGYGASMFFNRIGIYPNHVHVGIGETELYWVVKKYGDKIKYFDNIDDALDYV